MLRGPGILPGAGQNVRTPRYVGDGCILTELQCADVGGDRPAVLRRNHLSVRRHRAESIGHDVEEVSCGCGAESLRVKRRRTAIAARGNHAFAVADAAVALRAVDVEAALAAVDQLDGDGHREAVRDLAVDLAGVEERIVRDVAAGDGAGHARTRSHTVSE